MFDGFTRVILQLTPAFVEEIQIKKPEYAGLFYPSDPVEYKKLIELTLAEVGTLGPDYSDLLIRALLVPSSGFSYSGQTALVGYQQLQQRKYKKVIVLGSSHFFGFQGVAMTATPAFETIFGKISVDHETTDKLRNIIGFQFFENAFLKEYSIEIQLPYLHYFLGDFQLIPLIVGNKVDYEGVANALTNLLDDDTLLVLSTNLSHYHSAQKARDVDRKTIDALLARDNDALLGEGEASALLGISILNHLALDNNWQPLFLDYSESSQHGDDKDSVVGYGSLLYFQQ